jgi:hypothetical protein
MDEDEEEPNTGALALSLIATTLSLNLLIPRPSITVPKPLPLAAAAVRPQAANETELARGALSRSSAPRISSSLADAVAWSALSADTTRCFNAGRGIDEVTAWVGMLAAPGIARGVIVGGRRGPYFPAIELDVDEARTLGAVDEDTSSDDERLPVCARRRTVDCGGMGSFVLGGVRASLIDIIKEERSTSGDVWLMLSLAGFFRGVIAESLADLGGRAGGPRCVRDNKSGIVAESSTASFFLGLRQSMSSNESSASSSRSRERFFAL